MINKMDIALILVLASVVFLSACSVNEYSTLEDARQVAVDNIIKSYNYDHYEGTNFMEVEALDLGDDQYRFSYRFDINSTELPDVKGFKMIVTMNHTNIIDMKVENIYSLNCSEFNVDECPQGCIVCPPCPECSSISCQPSDICESNGYDSEWYATVGGGITGNVAACPVPIEDRFPENDFCQNQCGNGKCDDIVCQGADCPCEESKENCPEDCGK
jgi:hypothetical protein